MTKEQRKMLTQIRTLYDKVDKINEEIDSLYHKVWREFNKDEPLID